MTPRSHIWVHRVVQGTVALTNTKVRVILYFLIFVQYILKFRAEKMKMRKMWRMCQMLVWWYITCCRVVVIVLLSCVWKHIDVIIDCMLSCGWIHTSVNVANVIIDCVLSCGWTHTCENHQRPAPPIVPKGAQQQAEFQNGCRWRNESLKLNPESVCSRSFHN